MGTSLAKTSGLASVPHPSPHAVVLSFGTGQRRTRIDELTNPAEEWHGRSRFVVGIDLGTTNCASPTVDTGAGERAARSTPCPSRRSSRRASSRTAPLLPSFLYLPGPNELPAGQPEAAVGREPRLRRRRVRPQPRQPGADAGWSRPPSRGCATPASIAGAPILPWKAPEDGRKVSPLEASTLYLKHLVEAWNITIAKDVAGHRLEQQDIILTVPASFDAVARELTVEAARAAGLEHLTLLEEPQAAFYAWIDASRRRLARAGRGRRRRARLRRRRRHHRLHADRRQRGGGQARADARRGRRPHPARRRQHGPRPRAHAGQAFAAKGDQARRRPDAACSGTAAGSAKEKLFADAEAAEPPR